MIECVNGDAELKKCLRLSKDEDIVYQNLLEKK